MVFGLSLRLHSQVKMETKFQAAIIIVLIIVVALSITSYLNAKLGVDSDTKKTQFQKCIDSCNGGSREVKAQCLLYCQPLLNISNG